MGLFIPNCITHGLNEFGVQVNIIVELDIRVTSGQFKSALMLGPVI